MMTLIQLSIPRESGLLHNFTVTLAQREGASLNCPQRMWDPRCSIDQWTRYEDDFEHVPLRWCFTQERHSWRTTAQRNHQRRDKH